MASSDDILTNLRALARARQARGDSRLVIQPSTESQEQFAPPDDFTSDGNQGLVLEPKADAPFEARPLAPRRGCARIEAFCDGTRSTYSVGFEDLFPLLYARNAAVVRARDSVSGYHTLMAPLQRDQSTLLAPLGLFSRPIRSAYEQLGLCPTRYADLCWTPAADDEIGLRPQDTQAMGSQAWQGRGQRRARRLMERSEQIVTLAGASLLQDQAPDRTQWLYKDGSLFQFDKVYLQQPELLQNVVSGVKTHPISFFGVDGERTLARLAVGERSVAFLPRPRVSEDSHEKPVTLETTDRPIISWYLRVREPNTQSSNVLSGVIRLDIANTEGWQDWIDEVSWAVLDEFYGISAMPDPRYDVMPYGIYDCEQFLKAQQLPGELLLAQLG